MTCLKSYRYLFCKKMMVVFVGRDQLEPYHVVHIRHFQIEMIWLYVLFLPFVIDIFASSCLQYQIDFHFLPCLCRKIQNSYFSFCRNTLNKIMLIMQWSVKRQFPLIRFLVIFLKFGLLWSEPWKVRGLSLTIWLLMNLIYLMICLLSFVFYRALVFPWPSLLLQLLHFLPLHFRSAENLTAFQIDDRLKTIWSINFYFIVTKLKLSKWPLFSNHKKSLRLRISLTVFFLNTWETSDIVWIFVFSDIIVDVISIWVVSDASCHHKRIKWHTWPIKTSESTKRGTTERWSHFIAGTHFWGSNTKNFIIPWVVFWARRNCPKF